MKILEQTTNRLVYQLVKHMSKVLEMENGLDGYKWTNGWMDGWMGSPTTDGWMDEWMDEPMLLGRLQILNYTNTTLFHVIQRIH